jgi:hypothetical protein
VKDYKVVPASEARGYTRKSPMTLIRESVDGDFWSMHQVAAHIGVHAETIRRLCRKTKSDGTKVVNAPTSAVRSGEAVIYLFTIDDVREIENYFDDHGYAVPKRIDKRKTLASQVTTTS